MSKKREDAFWVSQKDLKETLEYISDYSLYAFEEEIRQGFITIQGGHRIGLAGKAVTDRDKIRSMKYISFINIRFSHQIRGCGNKVMPYLYEHGEVFHTLIVSPPRCGKTTLLRDVIRQISDGTEKVPGMTVGVVDERSEIGACYQGIPQNDLGIRTDILDHRVCDELWMQADCHRARKFFGRYSFKASVWQAFAGQGVWTVCGAEKPGKAGNCGGYL